MWLINFWPTTANTSWQFVAFRQSLNAAKCAAKKPQEQPATSNKQPATSATTATAHENVS